MIWGWPPTNRAENAETGGESLLPHRSTSGLILETVIKLFLDIIFMAHKLLLTLDFNGHSVFFITLKHWMIYCFFSVIMTLLLLQAAQATLHSKPCIRTEQHNPLVQAAEILQNCSLWHRSGKEFNWSTHFTSYQIRLVQHNGQVKSKSQSDLVFLNLSLYFFCFSLCLYGYVDHFYLWVFFKHFFFTLF